MPTIFYEFLIPSIWISDPPLPPQAGTPPYKLVGRGWGRVKTKNPFPAQRQKTGFLICVKCDLK
jgi:hypothetical protein